MARYIDAEKAEVERISCFYGSECRLEDVQEWLNEQPTADVEEVKHGKWITFSLRDPQCSLCHSYNFEQSNYCPNCGAKMDGGKGE